MTDILQISAQLVSAANGNDDPKINALLNQALDQIANDPDLLATLLLQYHELLKREHAFLQTETNLELEPDRPEEASV